VIALFKLLVCSLRCHFVQNEHVFPVLPICGSSDLQAAHVNIRHVVRISSTRSGPKTYIVISPKLCSIEAPDDLPKIAPWYNQSALQLGNQLWASNTCCCWVDLLEPDLFLVIDDHHSSVRYFEVRSFAGWCVRGHHAKLQAS
jgi:hypothetical protein